MITPQQLGNPRIKPKWNVPVGVMEGIVAYNCKIHGFPRPVVAMPMWEGAGNKVYDFSGYGNHGILDSVAAQDTGWSDNALLFDGTDLIQGMKLPSAITFGNDDKWTVAVRMNIEEGNNEVFIGEYNTAQNYIYNRPGVRTRLDAGGVQSDMNPYGSYGVTQDLTYVADGVGNTLTAYYDGNFHQQLTTITDTELVINTIGGAYNLGANCFQGRIYYIYVFDTTLTARQAKLLHDNPYFMFRVPEELYGYVPGIPGEAIMNQFQGPNIGADLFNGALL